MTNPNISPEQIQQYLPIFGKMPDAFWNSFTLLWTHYLGTGIGQEQAANEAMNALILGLPVVQKLIGNFNVGAVTGVHQTRVA